MSDLTFRQRVIDGVEYEDFKIGADPELRFKGMKARPHVPHEGKFGTDGPHSQVGELRPDEKFCPVNLTFEIQSVMKKGFIDNKIIRDTPWLAGSMPDEQPIGGHIHIGSPANIHLDRKLESLDKCLAPVILMLEENASAKKRRTVTSYGKLAKHDGKFRAANRGYKTKTDYYDGDYAHGLQHDGFEYRPLSSWLVSRPITLGTLCLAKVIAFEAHNQKLHRNLDRQLKFIPLDKKFSRSYVECDKRYFAGIVPTIHRIVTTMKLFPAYEKYINYLFAMIAQGRAWDENADLKDKWDIRPRVAQEEKKEYSAFSSAWELCLNRDGFIGDRLEALL